MLSLGVPGSGSTAMMMGALMMFGLRPGPMLFETNPDFVWGLIGSMYIGNIMLIFISILAIPLFVKALKTPTPIMNAIVIAFIVMGSYSLNNSMFDVGITVFMGLLGFFMKKVGIPAAPMVLSLVLGGMLENTLRQSMIIFDGNFSLFFFRPISGTILSFAVLTVLWPLLKKIIKTLKSTKEMEHQM
jgi:putative tricarboxylic transport membrane protein